MLKLIHANDMNFNSVKNYYDSFTDKWKDLNCYAISHAQYGPNEYFDFVNTYENNLFYLVDEDKEDYIIGFGTIEDAKILDYHKDYLNAGNIGYGIRPNERKKGYGTMLLKLLLLECEKMGMYEVCISCLEENIGSKKIIINNNGLLEKEFFDDDSGQYALKFWIKLHPKIINRTKRLVKRLREDY